LQRGSAIGAALGGLEEHRPGNVCAYHPQAPALRKLEGKATDAAARARSCANGGTGAG
jgi:hypothetical protein